MTETRSTMTPGWPRRLQGAPTRRAVLQDISGRAAHLRLLHDPSSEEATHPYAECTRPKESSPLTGVPRQGRQQYALLLHSVFLVGACTYLALPAELFLVQAVACGASFYAHVFFDKEYHVEGSRLQRFAWFRRKQELHFAHHRHA